MKLFIYSIRFSPTEWKCILCRRVASDLLSPAALELLMAALTSDPPGDSGEQE